MTPFAPPISEGGPGVRGQCPRDKCDGFTSDHGRCDCCTAVHLGNMPARDLGYALVPRISRARLPGRLLLLDRARMGHDSVDRPVPAAANERTFYMGRCRYQVS